MMQYFFENDMYVATDPDGWIKGFGSSQQEAESNFWTKLAALQKEHLSEDSSELFIPLAIQKLKITQMVIKNKSMFPTKLTFTGLRGRQLQTHVISPGDLYNFDGGMGLPVLISEENEV